MTCSEDISKGPCTQDGGLSALSDIEYPCGDAAPRRRPYEGEGGPGVPAGTAWLHDGHVPGVAYPGDVVSVEDQPGSAKRSAFSSGSKVYFTE